jgi:hypothetical protein
MLLPVSTMGQGAPHAVLVLEATTPNTSYFIGVNCAFNSAIATESFGQTLAVRDFEAAGYPVLLREFFRKKYRGKNIGAIVAYSTLALLYATRLRDEVWPGLPVIFTEVSDRHLANMKVASSVTGVTVRPIRRTIPARCRTCWSF